MAITRTQPLAGPVPHPGEVLEDELEARGLSAHALAIALRLPASRISPIVRGQRAITPEAALRLARYFGGSAAIWLRPGGLRPRARRSRTRREDRRRGHPGGCLIAARRFIGPRLTLWNAATARPGLRPTLCPDDNRSAAGSIGCSR